MVPVPMVVFGFNRPQLAREVAEVALAAEPTELFVVLDGPRPDRPGEADACAQVRQVFDDIDWGGIKVHRLDRPANAGCSPSIETGLDWVFDHVDRAIVMEDDCRPDPTFFTYCAELLERYADDERVMQIAGNSMFVPQGLFGSDSYRFASWASVWGWATWRRAWHAHRAVFPRTHRDGDHAAVHRDAGNEWNLVTPGGRRYFAEVKETPDLIQFAWDSHWWVSMIELGGLAITPARNHVRNVGTGVDATHMDTSRAMPPAVPVSFPLRHPARVEVDHEVEVSLEAIMTRANGRLARLVRPFVPQRLRGLARTAMNIVFSLAHAVGRIGRRLRATAR